VLRLKIPSVCDFKTGIISYGSGAAFSFFLGGFYGFDRFLFLLDMELEYEKSDDDSLLRSEILSVGCALVNKCKNPVLTSSFPFSLSTAFFVGF